MINRAARAGTIRVLLSDNNLAYLDAVARLLTLDPRVRIVGQALSAEDTLRQVTTALPDLVLLDIAVGEDSGLDVTRRIKSRARPLQVIVTSLYDTPAYRAAAQAAGADAFLGEADLGAELPSLIGELYGPLACGGEASSCEHPGEAEYA